MGGGEGVFFHLRVGVSAVLKKNALCKTPRNRWFTFYATGLLSRQLCFVPVTQCVLVIFSYVSLYDVSAIVCFSSDIFRLQTIVFRCLQQHQHLTIESTT